MLKIGSKIILRTRFADKANIVNPGKVLYLKKETSEDAQYFSCSLNEKYEHTIIVPRPYIYSINDYLTNSVLVKVDL